MLIDLAFVKVEEMILNGTNGLDEVLEVCCDCRRSDEAMIDAQLVSSHLPPRLDSLFIFFQRATMAASLAGFCLHS